jgi:hypothetical protein
MLSSIGAAENNLCLMPNSSLLLEYHLCSYPHPHLYMSCEPVSKVLAGYYLLPRPATIIRSSDSSQVNIKKKKSSSDRTPHGHWTVPSHSYDTVPVPGPGSGTGSGTELGLGTGTGSGSMWGTSLSIPTSGSSGSSGIESVKDFIVYVGKCYVQSAALLPVLC